jgi:hypothetical protein
MRRTFSERCEGVEKIIYRRLCYFHNGGTFGVYGEIRNACKIIMERSEHKSRPARSMYGGEDTIKMDIK